MENQYVVKSVEDTWKIAAQFAEELRPGDVVCLEGDLGAGKTTFTQGVGKALGVKRPVTSPTFCIVAEHPSPKFLFVHADLYRLHGPDDVLAIGWEDYLARGAVLFVEWADRAGELIPPGAQHVSFSFGASDDERLITFSNPRN